MASNGARVGVGVGGVGCMGGTDVGTTVGITSVGKGATVVVGEAVGKGSGVVVGAAVAEGSMEMVGSSGLS